jgi:hypothetical protein
VKRKKESSRYSAPAPLVLPFHKLRQKPVITVFLCSSNPRGPGKFRFISSLVELPALRG